MIRTILYLQAKHGRAEEVVSLYKAYDILQYSLDVSEAIASELSVATDGSGLLLVTALWPSVEAYQGWVDHPGRARPGDDLRSHLEDAPAVGLTFEIRQSVSK